MGGIVERRAAAVALIERLERRREEVEAGRRQGGGDVERQALLGRGRRPARGCTRGVMCVGFLVMLVSDCAGCTTSEDADIQCAYSCLSATYRADVFDSAARRGAFGVRAVGPLRMEFLVKVRIIRQISPVYHASY